MAIDDPQEAIDALDANDARQSSPVASAIGAVCELLAELGRLPVRAPNSPRAKI